MFAKILIIVLSFILLTMPLYAQNLGRLPTMEQIEKYCIAVRLKVDGDLHYFSFFTIVEFNEQTGIKIVYGKNKEKTVIYPKEDIENWDEAFAKYIQLVIDLGGIK